MLYSKAQFTFIGREFFNSTTEMGPDHQPIHPEAHSPHESDSQGENTGKNIVLATLQDKVVLSDASAVKSDVHTCISEQGRIYSGTLRRVPFFTSVYTYAQFT